MEYPARYSTVLAVEAVNEINKRPSFSAKGPALDLVAPGVKIESNKSSGGIKYKLASLII
ncbi:S8 family serine peptidase [Paenibacillus sp. HWE-109]|uniref:S8 family serine peptidase n=1 Tax=Paenibacillus sp. HWE-109 TaxID=1306526 RepID=UPI003FCC364A